MKRVLVCGGAGYIGSHMAKRLFMQGIEPIVLDNLSTGHREMVQWGELIEVDLLDIAGLEQAFSRRAPFDAVMHFCAKSLVGESVNSPYIYYQNNVTGTINLLQAMQRHGVNKIVFSSTAAVFGMPNSKHIDEDHPKAPINPYGSSKLMVERILQDAADAYGLRSVTLRYFNAAGASPDAEIGEAHEPETHLLPNILKAALRSGPPLKVFGNDWLTPDGTCVRDYVHVCDLAQAHLLAMEYMELNNGAHAFNLGNGSGHSVLEAITAAEFVTGKSIPYEFAPRRIGDPAVLVASSTRAMQELGWMPEYRNIESIIRTAWQWHTR